MNPIDVLEQLHEKAIAEIERLQGMAEGAVLTVVTLSNEVIRLRQVLERISEMGEAGSMSYTLAEIARAALEKAG